MKLWNLLSGHKTWLSALTGFCYMLGVWYGVFQYDQAVVDSIQVGVGVGLADKIYKVFRATR